MEPGSVDESRAINLVLNPGDVSIHHPNVTHGSNVNRSSRWRRGLTIRFIPTSTQITKPQPHPAAFIFRGKGYANGNGWNPLPAYTPETSMPFAEKNAWNAKCAVHKEKYGQFYAQPV